MASPATIDQVKNTTHASKFGAHYHAKITHTANADGRDSQKRRRFYVDFTEAIFILLTILRCVNYSKFYKANLVKRMDKSPYRAAVVT